MDQKKEEARKIFFGKSTKGRLFSGLEESQSNKNLSKIERTRLGLQKLYKEKLEAKNMLLLETDNMIDTFKKRSYFEIEKEKFEKDKIKNEIETLKKKQFEENRIEEEKLAEDENLEGLDEEEILLKQYIIISI